MGNKRKKVLRARRANKSMPYPAFSRRIAHRSIQRTPYLKSVTLSDSGLCVHVVKKAAPGCKVIGHTYQNGEIYCVVVSPNDNPSVGEVKEPTIKKPKNNEGNT